MPYQFSPSLDLVKQSAEVTVIVRINTDSGQAPLLAAKVVDAVRTAVDGTALTISVPTTPQIPTPRAPLDATLRIVVPSRRVEHHGLPVDLTRLEFDLLLFLCRRPNLVHLRSTLLSEVWGLPGGINTRTLDVHVRRLRSKLDPSSSLISTVRGVGYRITDSERIHIADTLD